MQYRELKKAIANGWILWFLAVVFIVAMSLFVRKMGDNKKSPEWEMGGKEFIPASSTYGNGYFIEPPQKESSEAADIERSSP